MARFFSVLSGSVPSELTSDFFDQRSISDGINKRNGLIASRSIVSTDVYEDLDAVNIDGSRGTYFPPNLLTAPDNPFIGEAYTSSIAGIVIPNDYRTRPTASVLSTTAGVGPTNPLDTVSVSYTSYLAASTAVKTVLDSITGGGPYGRIGLNVSRTLHSIWHDQYLGYFAWDDFTPGTASFQEPTISPGYVDGGYGGSNVSYVTSSSPNLTLTVPWTTEYLSDALGGRSGSFQLNRMGEAELTSSNFTANATNEITFSLDTGIFNGQIVEDGDPESYAVTASVQFADVTIPAHKGSSVTQSFADFHAVYRLASFNDGKTYIANSIAFDVPCYNLSTPIYALSIDPFDNPNSIEGTYRLWEGDPGEEPPFVPFQPTDTELPGYTSGADYWIIRSAGATPVGGVSADRAYEFTDVGVYTEVEADSFACFEATTTTTTTTTTLEPE
jgi:hypothetical protein